MRIRKTAAVILALIVAMSLAMPVFAATGYGPETIGGGSSGGGGGGSSYTPPSTSSAPTASNPAPATTAQVTTAATSAIQKAAASGGQATVSLVNVSTVPASAIKDVFTQATKAGITNTVIHLDAIESGVVLSRVYIDAATAAKLTGTIDFSVETKGSAVNRAINTFEKFFDNKVAAVSLGQNGAYGADIRMAVKADLSKLDTSSLVFYAYDKVTGKYTKLTAEYKIDAKGYLHFSTPVGGDIIISDKPLVRK